MMSVIEQVCELIDTTDDVFSFKVGKASSVGVSLSDGFDVSTPLSNRPHLWACGKSKILNGFISFTLCVRVGATLVEWE